jgi:hypothetical protein
MSYNYPKEISNDFLFHFPVSKSKDAHTFQNFDLNKNGSEQNGSEQNGSEQNDLQSQEHQNKSKKMNRYDIYFSKLEKNTSKINNFHFRK